MREDPDIVHETQRSRPSPAMRLFWAVAVLALLGWSVRIYLLAAEPHPNACGLVAWQFAAGAVYLIAVYAVLRLPGSISLKAIVGAAILYRLVLLPSQPTLSDAACRNLWNAKVFAEGINPYLHTPDAPALIGLRDANWLHLSDPASPSSVPPIGQLVVTALWLVGVRTAIGLKTALLVFDMVNILLISMILHRLRRPMTWVLVYAWSPLLIEGSANSGQLEPVMVFFLLAAFYLWFRPRANPAWAGACYAAAVMTRFTMAILAPMAYRIGGWRALLAGTIAAAAVIAPFLGAGVLVVRAFAGETGCEHFNDGAFALLRAAQAYSVPNAGKLPISPALVIAALVVGSYAAHSALKLRRWDRTAAVASARNVLAVCILMMPVVFPHTVSQLLPLLCIAPSIGLLHFTVTCNLAYLSNAEGVLPSWVPVLEYVPVYLILALEFLSYRRGAAQPDDEPRKEPLPRWRFPNRH